MMVLFSSLLISATLALGGATNVTAATGKHAKRPAKVTSSTAYYDRKEGVAILTGHVFVDDAEYAMHADKAYVFMSGTNDLKRIVAMGNVALTNGTKRAYGGKASYYRDDGLVILYAQTNAPARVVDVKPDGEQVVTGSKIKFWIGVEQVEVIDAAISAPADNVGSLDALKR